MQKLKRPPVIRPDGTIEIRLTQGYVAIIDAEDAHLAQHNWNAQVDRWGKVYAARNKRKPERGLIYLHGEIVGPGPGLCDHRDGDTLNCRRKNLRRATPTENSRNRSVPKNNTSGHLGVHLHRDGWRAQISRRNIGTFRTKEEAVAARLAAERELWGVQPCREDAHAGAE